MITNITGLVLLYYIVGLFCCTILTLLNYVAFAKRKSFVEENRLWRNIDRKHGIKTRTILSFTGTAALLTVSLLLTSVNTSFAVVLGTIVGFLLLNVMLDSNTLRTNTNTKCDTCEHEAQINTQCSICEHNKKTGMNPISDIVFALKTITKELK